MDSDVNGVVGQSRVFREEMKHQEALAKINTFIENKQLSALEMLFVTCEKVDILHEQGYINRAEDVADEALAQSAWDSGGRVISQLEWSWHDILHGKKAVAIMEANACFDYGLQVRRELMASHLDSELNNLVYDDSQVWFCAFST